MHHCFIAHENPSLQVATRVERYFKTKRRKIQTLKEGADFERTQGWRIQLSAHIIERPNKTTQGSGFEPPFPLAECKLHKQ